MPIQSPEAVLNRIEHLNEGLSRAVQSTGGAQFALLLSMISASQRQAYGLSRAAGEQAVADFDGAATADPLRSRDELYQPETVARLSESLHSGKLGDFHLLLSWLDTVPLQGRTRRFSAAANAGVGLSQAAVLGSKADLLAKSGYLMLDEIDRSSLLVAA